jgi:GntR family transcriptional regulator
MPEGLDRRSDRPLYLQIADGLRAEIVESRLAPGERAPSEHSLMERFGASRDTVRKAIGVLRTEGRLDAERGRGVFVRSQGPVQRLGSDRLTRKGRRGTGGALGARLSQPASAVCEAEVGRSSATADVASRLSLRVGDPVVVRRHLTGSGAGSLQLATSYLSLRLVRGSDLERAGPAPEGTEGIYARLEDLGYRLGRFEERVTARMPLPEEARILRLNPGTPVLCVCRTAFTKIDDRPVETCDTIMGADCFELHYHVPAR